MKAVVKNRVECIRFIDQIADKFDGKPYTLTIQKFHRPRTLDQNAKIHAMIRDIALHTGYTESRMKDIVKAEFGPIAVAKVGNRIVEAPEGTADYTIQEMSEFVEHMFVLGAEIGVAFTEQG